MGIRLHWFLPTGGDSRDVLAVGAGTALVGDHDEVAARIAEYHALGFEEFILSGHPHVEEAYWVGEHVRPRLVKAGLVTDTIGGRAVPKLSLSALSAR